MVRSQRPAGRRTESGGRIGSVHEGYGPELQHALAAHGSRRRVFKTGQDIFSLGAPFAAMYYLVDGVVFLYNLLEDGRRQILHFALPGAILGFHGAHRGRASYSAQALTDAVVCTVPHAALAALSHTDPQIGLRLAALVARDRSLDFNHLTSIGRQTARKRVAYLLLELFVRFRSQWPGERIGEIHLPLTQEDVGDATGLTFVHVNRVLRELRDEGLVDFRYRRLRVLDPDGLVDAADIDPQLPLAWVGR